MQKIYRQLDEIKNKLRDITLHQQSIKQQYEDAIQKRDILNDDVLQAKKARIIIQNAAMQTQNNLRYHISDLCTNGMHSIDPQWPKFVAEFETRRNKTELDLLFEENDTRQTPKASSGFGVVDIATICLRFSIWSLNKNRPFFALDEPFKNLSRNHSDSASKMLRLMCDKLGLQILMVSHDKNIVNFADRSFQCKKMAGVSKVIVVDEDIQVRKRRTR